MKRYLLFILMAFSFSIIVNAQSMSDDQIIEFVQSEQAKGTSQTQIANKLLKKGVSVTKLKELKKKMENGEELTSKKSTADIGNGLNRNRYAQVDNTDVEGDADAEKQKAIADKKLEIQRRSSKAGLPKGIKLKDVKDIMKDARFADPVDDDFMQMNGDKELTPMELVTMLGPETFGKYPELLSALLEESSKNKKVRIFGHDIFANDNLSFEPNMNIATPQSYKLGPGDAVYIDIYGASQKNIQTTVTPEGELVIEEYGPIHVGGLTVAQANSRLKSTLGTRFAGSNVRLTLGQTRSIIVNVMGEVVMPGTFTIPAFATVFHALYQAGGVNDIGTLRNIKVYRNNKLVSTVDVYDYILNGKLTGDVKLAENDVIIVGPYENLVSISGKVRRPMFYEMKKSETAADLLKYSGGFAGDAYQKELKAYRSTGSRKTMESIGEFEQGSFVLQDKDSVLVDSIINRYENTVEVSGALFRPGRYNLGGDITTVKALVEAAQGPIEEAFLNRVLLYRKKENRTTEMLALNLKGIMDGTVADVPLRDEDLLFVPTISEKLKEPNIIIYGDVIDPGQYLFVDNMTVEDAILQAGGLLPSASMSKIDVARRIVNPFATEQNDTIATTYSFAIKDGFVVDGGEDFILQPYDEIYVRTSPAYNPQRNVELIGAVQFPGTYTMPRKNMRLSEMITMAGGFSNSAYIKGTRLERQATDDEYARMKILQKLKQRQAADEDEAGLSAAKLDFDKSYTVEIDAEKAMANPGSQWDVVLKEEDHIVVPEFTSTVKITGDVMYPNSVSFRPGKSYRYYIEQAGGWGERAKKSRAYVIHMNGKVERASKATIEAGCEIVVPSKSKRQKMTAAERVAMVSGFTSLATVGVTLLNVLKK